MQPTSFAGALPARRPPRAAAAADPHLWWIGTWASSVTLFLVVLGAAYRDLRTLPAMPPWFAYLPFALGTLMAVLAVPLVGLAGATLNRIDLLAMSLTLPLLLTYAWIGGVAGYVDQMQMPADMAVALGCYWMFRLLPQLTFRRIDRSLRWFAVIATALSAMEFWSMNYGGPGVFQFSTYWNTQGWSGYHGSMVYYFGLGNLDRPWGAMALPQASGSLLAALFLFFLPGMKLRGSRTVAVVSLIGVYISGSRTAILVVVVGVMVSLLLSRRSQWGKVLGIMMYPLFAAVIVIAAIAARDPQAFDPVYQRTVISAYAYFSGHGWAHFLNAFFIGDGYLTSNHTPLWDTGDIAVLNWLSSFGVLACLLMFGMTWRALKAGWRLMRSNLKLYPAACSMVLLVCGLLLASLHYDTASRYPASAILLAALGWLSRTASGSHIGTEEAGGIEHATFPLRH